MVNVEPAVAPPPGNPRFPLFDGLRAIAVLSVLLTHTALLSGANYSTWYGKYTARLDVGVTVFFLISGFLLYRPFVAARLDGRSRPRIRDYARRRVLRIVPAYWLALTVLAFYPGLLQMWSGHSWAYYLFLQDYRSVWTIGGLAPAWSLAIEAGFYVALPLVAVFMWRTGKGLGRAGRVRSELVLVGALFAGSLALRAATPGSQLHVTLLGAFDWFALGMGLAVASAGLGDSEPAPVSFLRRFPSAAWVGAAALFWFASNHLGLHRDAFTRVTTLQNTTQHLVYGAIALLLLLPAVFAHDGGGLPRWVLRSRVLAWLGVVSYGIFLWHHPVALKLSQADHGRLFGSTRMLGISVATFAIAVTCACVSYYAVERPILRFKDRPFARSRRSRFGGTSEASGTAG